MNYEVANIGFIYEMHYKIFTKALNLRRLMLWSLWHLCDMNGKLSCLSLQFAPIILVRNYFDNFNLVFCLNMFFIDNKYVVCYL